MIGQALYWLNIAGSTDLLGSILVLVLVREIAPVLVGLMIVGRSGAVVLIELATLRAGGQYRTLDAQGIDPFTYLVLPRVLGLSLSTFCLTMVFITTALVVGHLTGTLLGIARTSFIAFLDSVLRSMHPTDYALLPVKTLAIGFAVGIVSCHTALGRPWTAAEVGRLIPRGFVRAVIAVFIVSGVVTLVL
jgi:phospholipid/cholesterol/gamma-HCH transport system permease protein